jgi:hypothetical protein
MMQDFTPQDWGQMGLMAGLSILSNNDGRMNNGQLLARGGLDALAGLKFRKLYEQAMARQAEQDAIARQKHDIEARKGQMELGEATRRNELMKRWQSGDQTAYQFLFPEQWAMDQREMLKHRNALALEVAKGGGKVDAPSGTYRPELGGFVFSDGSFKPLVMPEGYVPPKNTSADFLPLDVTARKELAGIAQLDGMTNYISDAIETAFTPDSKTGEVKGGTGLFIGHVPNVAKSRLDPDGNALRSAISNFSSQLMNWLSGAAVSDQERKRLEGFLPTVTDDEKTLRDKVAGYRDFVRTKGNSWRMVYGDQPVFGKMKSFADDKYALPPGFTELK